MSYVSVNPSLKNFPKPRQWKNWKANEYLVAVYENCDAKDRYNKPIFQFTVIESNFEAKKGETIYLNCGGNFQNLMNSVEEGEEVKIEYGGETEIKKGKWKGEMTHVIDVKIKAADSDTNATEDLI
jgi:hypothetical protein